MLLPEGSSPFEISLGPDTTLNTAKAFVFRLWQLARVQPAQERGLVHLYGSCDFGG